MQNKLWNVGISPTLNRLIGEISTSPFSITINLNLNIMILLTADQSQTQNTQSISHFLR